MFEPLLNNLRRERVPVGMTEWLLLLEALDKGVVEPDFTAFYQLARAILVKDEAWFNRFDKAFLATFKELLPEDDVIREILQHMAKGGDPMIPDEALRQRLQELGFDEVMDNFLKQLREGRYKGHEGGNKAIGRRGTSTQGADGYNPAGIRIGQQEGRHRSAIQIAEYRRFQEYSHDRVLDTRQMQAALRLLKKSLPSGPRDELDLDATIDATARNGGEIELIWDHRRIPTARVVLLLDVGGSMDPFADLVSRLFSAAKAQIRDLKNYYFHNCVYEEVWEDAARYNAVPVQRLIEQFGHDHWLILCGDAAMSPYELNRAGGAIDMYYRNSRTGFDYLQEMRDSFQRTVWLNPEPETGWEWTYTVAQIANLIRMVPLSLDGIQEMVRYLRASGGSAKPETPSEPAEAAHRH